MHLDLWCILEAIIGFKANIGNRTKILDNMSFYRDLHKHVNTQP